MQKAWERSSAKTEIKRQTQLYMTSLTEYYLLPWAPGVVFFFRNGKRPSATQGKYLFDQNLNFRCDKLQLKHNDFERDRVEIRFLSLKYNA